MFPTCRYCFTALNSELGFLYLLYLQLNFQAKAQLSATDVKKLEVELARFLLFADKKNVSIVGYLPYLVCWEPYQIMISVNISCKLLLLFAVNGHVICVLFVQNSCVVIHTDILNTHTQNTPTASVLHCYTNSTTYIPPTILYTIHTN